MDTKHLKKRGATWYVQMAVPVKLQAVIGKKTITHALNTRDQVEANKRKHQVVADIMQLFSRYDSSAIGWESPRNILNDARLAHREITSGEISEADAKRRWSIGVDEYANHHDLTPPQLTAIDDSYRIIDGETLLTISEALQHHLDEIEPRVLVKTYKTRKVRINNLIDAIGDMQLMSVTKLQARQYVNKSLASGMSDKTKANHLADVVAFWNWCEQAGLVDRSPFAGLKIQSSHRGKKVEQQRRAWKDSEVKKLLSEMHKQLDADDSLIAITTIGLYTGMRLEEICAMKKVDVYKNYFDIVEGKNKNAVRQVPIHPKLKPLLKQLKSKDDYLIGGLAAVTDDKKKGNNISKRFGRFTRKHVSDDRGLVYHSLRMSFTEKLEGAGVPETTADLLTGHARQGMSYGRYSKSLPIEQLIKAVNSVNYKL